MSNEVRRVEVLASGEVQAVFFRDSTRREAQRRGVTGWARNLDDGRVEAVFQGDPDAVAAMIRFVEAGPGHATVTDVEVREADPVDDERGFTTG